jgi:hypothetical protein
MKVEEFNIRMKEILKMDDKENRHIAADALMMGALEDLGYNEGVRIFGSIGKWYA